MYIICIKILYKEAHEVAEKMIVIGAGPGGLAAGMMLASNGFEVEVYEKQTYIGGRNSQIRLGEYKFDMGPTFLSMLHIAEELFQASGRNMHDYIQAVELDPMYELIFENKKLLMTRDAKK